MKTQAISLVIRLSGAVLSAGQTVLLARTMGAESLGVYAAILAITALLAIPASAGLGEFLTREVAIARSFDRTVCIRGLIKSTNALLIVYSAIAIIALFILEFLRLTPSLDLAGLLLSSLIIPVVSADLLRAGAMRGLGSALLSQLPENLIRPGMFLVLLSIDVATTGSVDVHGALTAYVVAGISAATFGQLVLHRMVQGYRHSSRISLRSIARRSAGQTALGGTQIALANIDILILSVFGFYAAAGQYKVALLGVVALLFMYYALSAVAVRDLASSMARSAKKRVIEISDRLTLWGTLATGSIALVYLVIGRPAISAIFGTEFSEAYGALLILALGNLIGVTMGPTSEIVRLLPSQRRSVMLNLVGLGVTIALAISLLAWNPLFGVSIGIACGNVTRRSLLSAHIKGELKVDLSIVGALHRRFS